MDHPDPPSDPSVHATDADGASVLSMLESLSADLGHDSVAVIVDSYLATVEDRHESLRRAADSADRGQISRLAHAYKSSAAALGATTLAAALQSTEQAAHLGPEVIALGEAARETMQQWRSALPD